MGLEYIFTTPTDELEFKALQEKIRQERGIDCFQYKSSYLKRRLAVRLRANNLRSYGAYSAVLDQDPLEYEKFFDTLTINVTKFFRDPETYAGFARVALPEILMRKTVRTVKIWSAGCASGEEPYTIAILLLESLGRLGEQWVVQILGTDIDPVILEQARRGEYAPKQVEEVEPELLRKYFARREERYVVGPQLRKCVRFVRENLIEAKPHLFTDAIFCRNLMIYFAREIHGKLYDCFYRSLNEGGYLVVGNTEVLLGEVLGRFRHVPGAARVYQRVGPAKP